ncbi:MAG: RluA family pseudouridine synthase [Ruminococcaceae bacterium]|nr:RluA family pseudouridine synthase [Oscillospiraceae bacterium]
MEDIKILYEDKHLTVCVKPPLILSQQDSKGSPDMTEALRTQLGTVHKVVHRLDFGVGGTMVYAKTDVAAGKLSAAVSERSFKKEYLAVIYGTPEKEEGIYKDLLFKDSTKNKSFVVDRMRKGVKEASLEYKLLETKETDKGVLSLVHVKLHTGRTHQIRVQFASRKTPLYGDGKYGSKTSDKTTALWSYRLNFAHPITKKEIFQESLPPSDFPWNLFDFLKK